MQTFESAFSIGEEVNFKRYQSDIERGGTIASVTFTKAKVFYNILDDVTAEIKNNVDSSFVTPAKEIHEQH